jgi:endonuclease YncB( thermonuclease family)
MRAQTTGRLGIVGVVTCIMLAAATPVGADEFVGRVVRVLDGDTVDVLSADRTLHRVRLSGIDAPEKAQPFGNVSKRRLVDLVSQLPVRVTWAKFDRYGRIIGKIETRRGDACLALVEQGLAWHYKQYAAEQTPEDRVKYAAAEVAARAVRRGLWADLHPEAPWDFRHRHKGKRKKRRH